VIFQIRTLLYFLFLSLFVDIALEPAVQALVKRGWKRRVAAGVVFLAAAVLFIGFLVLLVPVLIAQGTAMVENLPGYAEELVAWANRTFGLELSVSELGADFEIFGELIERFGSELAGGLLAFGSTVFGLIFQIATVTLFGYYLLAEGPSWRRLLLSTLSAPRQQRALSTWDTAVEKTGQYVYSRALLALVATAFTWGVLAVLGVPSPLPLAVWMGVTSQFIPVIGTYVGMVLPAIAGLAVSPLTGLWVVVAMVGYQQLENYVIAPRITSRTMSIHPAVSIGAVIAGASLLGGVGAILALPLTAIIQALVSSTLSRHDVIDSDSLEDAETV
jgi:predicted PurR-regulated permease PerM